MKDYYYILGIKPDSSEHEIKKAYRKLSVKFHPDKNSGDEFFENRFKEIQEAYDTLANREKRKKYNTNYKLWNSKSKNQNYSSHKNEKGEIISFESSKKSIKDNQELTLFWATRNVSSVQLSCFNGRVPTTGKKTLKITAKESKDLLITLEAITLEKKVLARTLNIKYITDSNSIKGTDSASIEKIETKRKSKGFKILLLAFIAIILLAIVLGALNVSNKKTKNDSEVVLNSTRNESRLVDNINNKVISDAKKKDLMKEKKIKSKELNTVDNIYLGEHLIASFFLDGYKVSIRATPCCIDKDE